jgi:hypothetical protein
MSDVAPSGGSAPSFDTSATEIDGGRGVEPSPEGSKRHDRTRPAKLQLSGVARTSSGDVVNIGGASDVNTLLQYILGQRRPTTGKPAAGDQALAAAERLADRANRVLSACISGPEIRLNDAYFRTRDHL